MTIIDRPKDGDELDACDTMYPSILRTIQANSAEFHNRCSTFYGFVLSGSATIKIDTITIKGSEGFFFSAPDQVAIEAPGTVIVVERFGYRSQLICGKIESAGRLTYIDGCSSSILVAPSRLGDPILNHLHFPAGVIQTEHVHPSIRFGVVSSGHGVAFGAHEYNLSERWERELVQGAVFYLPALERHAFKTVDSDKSMDIISFHPESDWGPTDQSHPMLTRTLIRGDK